MFRAQIEAMREGVVGKILGYTAMFAVAFLLIFVILMGIERYQPK